MDSTVFDEDYFMRGPETGKSLYSRYSWKPELTIPMAQRIIDHCGIKKGARVLDFGCARGYTVKAMRGLGIDAYGYDISEWAVRNADPEVIYHVTNEKSIAFSEGAKYEWIIAKDVLEHVEYVEYKVIELMNLAREGVFAVVPLSRFDNSPYVVEEYEKDVTHCQRWTLATWVKMFLRPGWTVEASYRVPGVKDNYAQYPTGNGFVTARRIKE